MSFHKNWQMVVMAVDARQQFHLTQVGKRQDHSWLMQFEAARMHNNLPSRHLVFVNSVDGNRAIAHPHADTVSGRNLQAQQEQACEQRLGYM
jgi:hypothetical protein